VADSERAGWRATAPIGLEPQLIDAQVMRDPGVGAASKLIYSVLLTLTGGEAGSTVTLTKFALGDLVGRSDRAVGHCLGELARHGLATMVAADGGRLTIEVRRRTPGAPRLQRIAASPQGVLGFETDIEPEAPAEEHAASIPIGGLRAETAAAGISAQEPPAVTAQKPPAVCAQKPPESPEGAAIALVHSLQAREQSRLARSDPERANASAVCAQKPPAVTAQKPPPRSIDLRSLCANPNTRDLRSRAQEPPAVSATGEAAEPLAEENALAERIIGLVHPRTNRNAARKVARGLLAGWLDWDSVQRAIDSSHAAVADGTVPFAWCWFIPSMRRQFEVDHRQVWYHHRRRAPR